LLDAFAVSRPGIEVNILESYGGALARDLRDGRLDAVLAPSMFGAGDFRSVELACEPWVVLVGESHRLAGEGAIDASDLQGEEFVVTGHRDGASYDRAVADTLSDLGVTSVLRRGGPGPALLSGVAAGDVLALTSLPGVLEDRIAARQLEPQRTLSFQLLWHAETPSPALGELIRTSEVGTAQDSDTQPALRAVA
jgi:DNA-binding transcriptional LysR family regulator